MNRFTHAVALFCMAVSPSLAYSQAAQLEKMTLMSAGPAISFAPVYLLELLGYAKEEGLDYSVKTVFANSLNLVVAGEGDLSVLGLSSALVPAREGKETSIV